MHGVTKTWGGVGKASQYVSLICPCWHGGQKSAKPPNVGRSQGMWGVGGGVGREGERGGGCVCSYPLVYIKATNHAQTVAFCLFLLRKDTLAVHFFSTLFGVVSIFLRSSSAAVVVCSYRTHNSPPTPLFKFYFLFFYFTGHSAIKELLLLLLLFRRVGVYIKTLEIFWVSPRKLEWKGYAVSSANLGINPAFIASS